MVGEDEGAIAGLAEVDLDHLEAEAERVLDTGQRVLGRQRAATSVSDANERRLHTERELRMHGGATVRRSRADIEAILVRAGVEGGLPLTAMDRGCEYCVTVFA